LATAKHPVKEYFKEHQDQLEMEARRFLSKFEFTESKRQEKKLKNFFGEAPISPTSSSQKRKVGPDKKSKLEQFFGMEMSYADLKNQRVDPQSPKSLRKSSGDVLAKTSSDSLKSFISKSPSFDDHHKSLPISALRNLEGHAAQVQIPNTEESLKQTAPKEVKEETSAKEQNVSKEETPAKEQNVSKEEPPAKEQNVSKEVAPTKEQNAPKEVSKQTPAETKSPTMNRRSNVLIIKPQPPRVVKSASVREESVTSNSEEFNNGLRALPKINLADIKLKPVSRRTRAPTAARTYPYAVLIDKQTRPKECNPDYLERYLDDAEFKEIIGMSKEIFYQLPIWKQNDLKRRNNSFCFDLLLTNLILPFLFTFLKFISSFTQSLPSCLHCSLK
jgi:hypothetical protein